MIDYFLFARFHVNEISWVTHLTKLGVVVTNEYGHDHNNDNSKKVTMNFSCHHKHKAVFQGPLLLTWFNFNPSMDK